jgi:protein-S-isoprenylcysteine O-methyltransferase Ste14
MVGTVGVLLGCVGAVAEAWAPEYSIKRLVGVLLLSFGGMLFGMALVAP